MKKCKVSCTSFFLKMLAQHKNWMPTTFWQGKKQSCKVDEANYKPFFWGKRLPFRQDRNLRRECRCMSLTSSYFSVFQKKKKKGGGGGSRASCQDEQNLAIPSSHETEWKVHSLFFFGTFGEMFILNKWKEKQKMITKAVLEGKKCLYDHLSNIKMVALVFIFLLLRKTCLGEEEKTIYMTWWWWWVGGVRVGGGRSYLQKCNLNCLKAWCFGYKCTTLTSFISVFPKKKETRTSC